MLNHYWANDWAAFQNLTFTQGPLAFLQYPLPIKNNLLQAQLTGLAVRAVLGLGLMALFYKPKPKNALPVIVLFIAMQAFAGNHLIFLVTLLVSVLASQRNSHWLLAVGLLAALNWQIRLVPGLIGFALAGWAFTYALIKAPRQKAVFFYLPLFIVFHLGLELSLRGTFNNILELYQNYAELLFGGNSSLVAGQPAPAAVILLVLLAIGSLVLIPQLKVYFWVTPPFVIVLGLAGLYFLARPGQGPFLVLTRLSCASLLLYLALVGLNKPKVWLACAAFGLALFLTSWWVFGLSGLPYTKLKPGLAWQQMAYPKPHKIYWQKNLTKKQINLPLPSACTLAVYPWHFIPFYQPQKFKLKSPPLLQSYLAKSPVLDAKNAQFFEHLPKGIFLLLHPPNFNNNPLETLGGHYFFNEAPLTSQAIFKNFKMVEALQNGYYLLQKIASKEPHLEVGLIPVNMKPNSWHSLPFVKKPTYGLLTSSLQKLEIDSVFYQAASHAIFGYAINEAQLASGIYLGPFTQRVWPTNEAKTTRIFIKTKNTPTAF